MEIKVASYQKCIFIKIVLSSKTFSPVKYVLFIPWRSVQKAYVTSSASRGTNINKIHILSHFQKKIIIKIFSTLNFPKVQSYLNDCSQCSDKSIKDTICSIGIGHGNAPHWLFFQCYALFQWNLILKLL